MNKNIIEAAKPYFKSYPKVNTFYVTSDGMFFTPENRNAGVDHANKLKTPLVPISRKDIEDVVDSLSDRNPKGEAKDIPTDKWKNDDIKKYMLDKGIGFEEEDTKKVLLEKIENFVSDSNAE